MIMFKKNVIKLLLLTVISVTLYNCSKKKEVIEYTEDNPIVKINEFIWKGMNVYYKWQSKVPDLSDRRFSSEQQLKDYLTGFKSPAKFFSSLLYQYGTTDRFSWIVQDYEALEKSFQGIRTTTGMKVVLYKYKNGSDSRFAYVRDVVAGSDADKKGVKRGMIFNKVNGAFITENNYSTLFNNNSLTITIADYNNGNPVATEKTFDLVKTEVKENPVKIAKIINRGDKKIGYLMYNQFASSYDGELNKAFATFKAGGITDLIVDLRYNGGGSVRTATYLGSMITGQFTGQLYSKQIWNEKVMKNVDNAHFKNYFTNEINNGTIKEPINSVNMTKVYFIVTNRTASASELVINALKAYIDVKLIGSQTVGKQVGSITLYDSENFMKSGKNLNSGHKWAMQPIVLEITNKNGENNPNGYIPEIQMEESIANSGVLGDPSEPMLKRTLQYMTSGARTSGDTFETETITKEVWNSEMDNLDYNKMYVDFK